MFRYFVSAVERATPFCELSGIKKKQLDDLQFAGSNDQNVYKGLNVGIFPDENIIKSAHNNFVQVDSVRKKTLGNVRESEKSHSAVLNHKRPRTGRAGRFPILSSRVRGIKRLYSPVRNSHSGILYQEAAETRI